MKRWLVAWPLLALSGCAAGAKSAPPTVAPASGAVPPAQPAATPGAYGAPSYAAPAPAPAPTSSPAPMGADRDDAAPEREFAQPPPAPPPAKKSAPATAPADRASAGGATGHDERGPAIAGEERRLTGLAREVAGAVEARDCPGACRALDSMERAAAQVCRLVTTDERDRCERAQATAQSARDRVMATCGGCAAR